MGNDRSQPEGLGNQRRLVYLECVSTRWCLDVRIAEGIEAKEGRPGATEISTRALQAQNDGGMRAWEL